MSTWILAVAAAIAVVALIINLYHRFGSDRISVLSEKRRATSRLVSRGEFFDGNRHQPVALALTDSALYYENAELQAWLDLRRVREVQYDTCLSTGQSFDHGQVLRLRGDSQTFEFIVPDDQVTRWHSLLPRVSR